MLLLLLSKVNLWGESAWSALRSQAMQQRACVTDGADEVSRVDAQRAVPQLLAQSALR